MGPLAHRIRRSLTSHHRLDAASPVSPADVIAAAARDGFSLDATQLVAAELLTGTGSLYLLGPAGRGKTWLIDTYCRISDSSTVRRIHRHEFLRELHAHARERRDLDAAVADILRDISVLCFDELDVNDRADGIYVHHFFAQAIRRGIRLLITSNSAPDDLMPNPLIHHTFAPTIALITRHCQLVHLDGGIDYRTRTGTGGHSGFAAGRWIVQSEPRPAPHHTVGVRGRPLLAASEGTGHLHVSFDHILRATVGCRRLPRPGQPVPLLATHRRTVLGTMPAAARCASGPSDRRPLRRRNHSHHRESLPPGRFRERPDSAGRRTPPLTLAALGARRVGP